MVSIYLVFLLHGKPASQLSTACMARLLLFFFFLYGLCYQGSLGSMELNFFPCSFLFFLPSFASLYSSFSHLLSLFISLPPLLPSTKTKVRREVLEGLLGADLVGFQTYSFARHFLQTCSRLLSVDSSPKGIQLENTAVNVGIFPIGIDTKTLNVKRQDPEVAQWVQVLKEKYAGMKLIVAREKLDYIKGVRQKMLAFERFLDLYPKWQGKVMDR